MSMSRRARLANILFIGGATLPALAALLHLTTLSYIFVQRLVYPLDVEWMEGGVLGHALRLMRWQPLYAPPSVDFISFLYTPFYPALLALLGKLFGLSYFLARLTSILAFSGALFLILLIVCRQQNTDGQTSALRLNPLWAVASMGLVAAVFPHTEAWFDLARNDSLFLLLISANLYLLVYRHHHWPSLLIAALLAALAFFTKQTGVIFIFFSGAALLWLRWRRLPAYAALVGLLVAGGIFVLNHYSHGWFWQYVFQMHQRHELYWSRVWPESEWRMFKVLPVPAVLLAVWLGTSVIYWIKRRQLAPRDRENLVWFFGVFVAVASGAIGFATQWAEENAYIPAFFFAALLCAVAAIDIAQKVGALSGRAWLSGLSALVCGAAVAAQLAVLVYPNKPHLPTGAHRAAARDLLSILREQPGDVLMPYHPFYPVLAGKNAYYHQMGINDVTSAGLPFPADIVSAVRRRAFGAIVLDTPPGERYDFIYGEYKLTRWFPPSSVPPTYTGYLVRPAYLFAPISVEPRAVGSRVVFDFEQGGFPGWQLEGRAFGQQPVSRPTFGQGPVGPYQGRYFVNSSHGGDESTGRLLSPEFLLDKPRLSYRVGGGAAPGRLVIRVLVDGQAIHEATAGNSDIMQERRVDISAHQGKNARLELIDNESGSWGHLLFDELLLRDQ